MLVVGLEEGGYLGGGGVCLCVCEFVCVCVCVGGVIK